MAQVKTLSIANQIRQLFRVAGTARASTAASLYRTDNKTASHSAAIAARRAELNKGVTTA
jgi:hypothetical protein